MFFLELIAEFLFQGVLEGIAKVIGGLFTATGGFILWIFKRLKTSIEEETRNKRAYATGAIFWLLLIIYVVIFLNFL
jgi:hypothetical protein